jgi:hypothetical protein
MNSRPTPKGWYVIKLYKKTSEMDRVYYTGVSFVDKEGASYDFSEIEYLYEATE